MVTIDLVISHCLKACDINNKRFKARKSLWSIQSPRTDAQGFPAQQGTALHTSSRGGWMQAPMETTGFPEHNIETRDTHVPRLAWGGSWNGLEVLAYRLGIAKNFFTVTFRKHALSQPLQPYSGHFHTDQKTPKGGGIPWTVDAR